MTDAPTTDAPTTDTPMTPRRRAIVTGANTGLGLASTYALAAAGWAVTLAVRSPDRGAAAAESVRAAVPGADLEVRALDLADLASVRAFADGWAAPIDLLMNNAGMMMVPELTLTTDGFEQQLGVNQLGHHLLTALLLDRVAAARGRVVSLSSIAHHQAKTLDHDLNLGDDYTPAGAHAQSKLATLMFALELDRRLRRHAVPVTSVAAHPGWSATDTRAPRERGDDPSRSVAFSRRISQLLGASAAHGARSQVFAGVDPEVLGGDFWGPRWLTYGPPHHARASAAARNVDQAQWLFAISEKLTGAALLD